MWQTKYASAVPKNLGVGVNFRPCSEDYFLSGRPQSVVVLITYAFVFLNRTHSLKMFWERKFEIFIMVPVSKNLVKDKKRRKEENQKNPRLQFFMNRGTSLDSKQVCYIYQSLFFISTVHNDGQSLPEFVILFSYFTFPKFF